MQSKDSNKFSKHVPSSGEFYQYNETKVQIDGIEYNEQFKEYYVNMHDTDHNGDPDRLEFFDMPISVFQELMNSGCIVQLDDGIERAINRVKTHEKR